MDGIDKLFSRLKGEMDVRFEKVDTQLQEVKVEVSHVKDEINGLKAELSDTPSRREFNELKEKVEEHIQLPH